MRLAEPKKVGLMAHAPIHLLNKYSEQIMV